MSRWRQAGHRVALGGGEGDPVEPDLDLGDLGDAVGGAHLASDAFIRREAFSISGKRSPTPAQNSFMPAPVPVDLMIGVPSRGLARATRSATALANG